MKILLCTNSFENIVNGPAKFANLILEINSIYPEYEIRILTEDISEFRLKNERYVYKVDLKFPSVFKIFGQILRMFIYYKRAEEIRKEFNYNLLIYINAFNGLYGSMISQVPTVGMINDYNNLDTKLSKLQFNRFWIKRFFFKQLERLSTRFHQLIITNSDNLTDKIIKEYNLPSYKIARLYKAVDVSENLYSYNRAFKMPIQILFVKADYMCGGIDSLAAALALLKEYKFCVTIIGPEDRFKKEVLSFFVDKSNIQVRFLGRQSQRVVKEYLQSCDIFCVPSVREALGVANIEALAAGAPVVTTNVGGIPEVLDYGNNGWLVNPNQPAELAAAIEDCINNEQKRLEKSLNGKKFIQRFSKEQMFSNFLDLLKDVCITKDFQVR